MQLKHTGVEPSSNGSSALVRASMVVTLSGERKLKSVCSLQVAERSILITVSVIRQC